MYPWRRGWRSARTERSTSSATPPPTPITTWRRSSGVNPTRVPDQRRGPSSPEPSDIRWVIPLSTTASMASSSARTAGMFTSTAARGRITAKCSRPAARSPICARSPSPPPSSAYRPRGRISSCPMTGVNSSAVAIFTPRESATPSIWPSRRTGICSAPRTARAATCPKN